MLAWAIDAQADDPAPSTTVDRDGLDVLQADAAAAVAGHDRLVVVVGPAGAGKTTTLPRAVEDWRRGTGRCSVSPPPPKPPGSWNVRPGWTATPSPSSSTNGTAPTGHRTPATGSPPGRR